MTAAMTETRHQSWCEDSEQGHGDAPCRFYAGAVADGHMSLSVVTEHCGDDDAEVVLTHDWRRHVETVVLTPAQARMVARHLTEAARRGERS